MKVEVIEKEDRRGEYPCIVIDDKVGDGAQPTIYLKPAAHISIVLVLGYLGKQMDWKLGHFFDSNDPRDASDFSVEVGDPIHDELPLYDGKVIIEN